MAALRGAKRATTDGHVGRWRRRHGRARRTVLAVSAGVGMVFALMPAQASAVPVPNKHAVDTIATGLDNPRGLAFLRNGNLVVAEAGHAGDVCLFPGGCVGLNGQITSINTHSNHHTPLATGIAS